MDISNVNILLILFIYYDNSSLLGTRCYEKIKVKKLEGMNLLYPSHLKCPKFFLEMCQETNLSQQLHRVFTGTRTTQLKKNIILL